VKNGTVRAASAAEKAYLAFNEVRKNTLTPHEPAAFRNEKGQPRTIGLTFGYWRREASERQRNLQTYGKLSAECPSFRTLIRPTPRVQM
jgi:hypothetical protein